MLPQIRDEVVHATLPDGRAASMPGRQWRQVWRLWLALAPVVAERGEGLCVEVEGDLVHVTSIYAPRWQAVHLVIDTDGSVSVLSEPDAPDVEVTP